ncbi:MAG: hypothetical protein O9343_13800 [Burkholderiaceae bacterium]|nr:hypothetical protein [Burkholderiaceae bacterium]MCZ8176262.1 hypothetical protein [Burkholderiaceae bacterium]
MPLMPMFRGNEASATAVFNNFAALGALHQDGGTIRIGSRLTIYEAEDAWRTLHLPLLAFTTICGSEAILGGMRRAMSNEAPRGGSSRWTERDLAQVEGYLSRLCVCTTDGLGLTAEFGLAEGAHSAIAGDHKTALFQLMADQPHPELGGGLPCLLQMPHQVADESRLQRLCLQLNQMEMAPHDLPPHFGAWCPGRLLSVLYAALHPKAPLKNLVCMAAPVNGDGLESLKAWMGPGFDEEALIEQYGNVPADWVQNTLRALRPFGKLGGAMNLLNQVDNDEIVRSNLRMGKWETDNIPFPGGVFRQMVNDFLRGNKLVRGEWLIGGRRVSLADVKVPLLHLLAADDHITPYASSRDLVLLAGSRDKQELIVKGGHVGLVAGRGAQTRMWPALEAWLAPRSV